MEKEINTKYKREFTTEWENYGDVNPKEHGGVFTRIEGDYVKTISIQPVEFSGVGYLNKYNQEKWFVQTDERRFSEILNDYENHIDNIKKSDVGDYADWKNIQGHILDKVLIIAGDYISYYGDDSAYYVNDFEAELIRLGIMEKENGN